MSNDESAVARTCQFYAAGKSEKELLAYDEYDSGSGRYFTDDAYMCDRYGYETAEEVAENKKLKVYLVTITKTGKNRKVEIDEM